jgi:hypothetical protein
LLREFHSRNTNAVSASVDCLIEACTPTQPGNSDLPTDNRNKKETNPKLKSYKNVLCPEKEESQLTSYRISQTGVWRRRKFKWLPKISIPYNK